MEEGVRFFVAAYGKTPPELHSCVQGKPGARCREGVPKSGRTRFSIRVTTQAEVPSSCQRQRAGKLCLGEMLFIMMLFHLSAYRDFKNFWCYGVEQEFRHCFCPASQLRKVCGLNAAVAAVVGETGGEAQRVKHTGQVNDRGGLIGQ